MHLHLMCLGDRAKQTKKSWLLKENDWKERGFVQANRVIQSEGEKKKNLSMYLPKIYSFVHMYTVIT